LDHDAAVRLATGLNAQFKKVVTLRPIGNESQVVVEPEQAAEPAIAQATIDPAIALATAKFLAAHGYSRYNVIKRALATPDGITVRQGLWLISETAKVKEQLASIPAVTKYLAKA
jgi:hypothetical protein